MRPRLIALAVSASLLQGCSTNLKVYPLVAGDSGPAKGAQYSLPFSRYKISIARVLTKCTGTADTPELELAVTVIATQLTEPDPSQTYVIDTGSLSNWLKTSELSWFVHENGMLKTIGVAADDFTGQVIANVVSGALKIGQAVLTGVPPLEGAAAPESAKPDPRALPPCTKEVNDAHRMLPKLRSTLSAATRALEAESTKLKTMADVVAPFGEAPAAGIQTRLVDQAREVADRQNRLRAAESALQDALGTVTDVETRVWPKDGNTIYERHVSSAGRFTQWLSKPPSGELLNLDFRTEIVPLSDLAIVKSGAKQIPPKANGSNLDGIRYRVPVRGALRLTICDAIKAGPAARAQEKAVAERRQREAAGGRTPEDDLSCPAEQRVRQTVAEGPVPQLGRIFVVPFWNGPFQSNTLNLEFAADGTMTSGKYAERAARAQVASDVFNQTAGTFQQGLKDLRTTRSQKELQEIKAQTELLVAKKDLREAAAALQPKSTEQTDREKAILASDTALLEAQRAKIEAQLALEAARTKAQGGQ